MDLAQLVQDVLDGNESGLMALAAKVNMPV